MGRVEVKTWRCQEVCVLVSLALQAASNKLERWGLVPKAVPSLPHMCHGMCTPVLIHRSMHSYAHTHHVPYTYTTYRIHTHIWQTILHTHTLYTTHHIHTHTYDILLYIHTLHTTYTYDILHYIYTHYIPHTICTHTKLPIWLLKKDFNILIRGEITTRRVWSDVYQTCIRESSS